MIIPSLFLAYKLIEERNYTQNAENFIKSEFTDNGFPVIYKKINYHSQPKKIELVVLNYKLDSTELEKINNRMANFGITETDISFKENKSEIKSEILAEINKQNSQFSEKDLVIQNLTEELNSYKIDKNLIQEITTLFPQIKNISIGKINNYSENNNSTISTIILYKTDENINEQQLKNWLSTKLNDSQLKVIKQN